jgi:cyclic beta-1,2-glucan synthetase
VSGDLPILLVTIENAEGLPTLRQVFAAHHLWRRRGLAVDLVVLNTRAVSYLEDLTGDIGDALSPPATPAVTNREACSSVPWPRSTRTHSR